MESREEGGKCMTVNEIKEIAKRHGITPEK